MSFAVCALVAAGVISITTTPAQASSVVTNVIGTPANASVALTWAAPTTGLPQAFGSIADAAVVIGGWGGNESRRDCPTGYAVTGVGTSGANRTSIQFRCTQLQADGTWQDGATTSNISVYNATATTWQYCSTGKVAIAVLGDPNNFWHSLALRCATSPDAINDIETTAYTGTTPGSPNISLCASGRIITNFYVRTGAWIDMVRSSCAVYGPAAITDYRIQYSSNNGTSWTSFSATASAALSRTVTGLTNGTSYIFRVAHFGAGSQGGYSDPSPAYIPFTTPPAPTALTAVRGNREVQLSWAAPTSNNGRDITDYVVQYSTNNSTWVTFNDGTSTDTSTTVTGLTNGTGYYFRVAAVNQAGTGTYTASTGVQTPATIPNAPSPITGTFGNSQVTLTWTAPANGGSAITNYFAQFSLDGDDWTTFSPSTVSTTASRTVTGLTNYTSYYFRVATVNAVGMSEYSSPITVVPGIRPGSVTPTIATAGIGNTEITLTWLTNVTEAASVTDWIVQYSTNNSTWITFDDGVSTEGTATVTGLTNGTGYYFRVAAVNPATQGLFGSSAYAVPRTVPNAPVFTTLTPANGQITVAWSAPANGGNAISDYDLEYRLQSDSTWTVWALNTTNTATSIAVTGLTNGSRYVFRVLAKNAAGSGAYSALSSPTIPRTTPTVPGNPTAVASDREVTVTWTAPTSNGGSAITDYVIQRYGSGAYVIINDGVSTATTFVDMSVVNGIGYQYRVWAINAAGDSSATSWSTSVVPAGLTVAPMSLRGTAGLGLVTLNWTAPANNGSAITNYAIEFSTDNGTTWTLMNRTASTSTSSVQVTGLVNGVGHIFRVAAINGVGQGAWATPTTELIPRGVPDVPVNLLAVPGDREITLTWTAPSENGSAISDYIIERYPNSSGSAAWGVITDGVSTATTWTNTGLVNGSTYYYRIRARNAVGDSANTAQTSPITPRTVPSAPTAPAASVTGARQARVTWTAPANNGGSAITGYAVRFSTDAGATWSDSTLTGSTTASYTVNNLQGSTPIIFSVAAINSAGQGAWSTNTTSVTTQDYADPPTNVVGVEGNSQISLTWVAPVNNGGSAITNYRVEYSSNNGTTWTFHNVTASTALSRTVTGLTNGTNYVFRITAVNSWGYERYSDVSDSLSPFTLPNAPTNVVGAPGSAQVAVTWTAPTSNGGRSISDYIVQFSSNNGTTWMTFPDGVSSSTSTLITGLMNGETYRFRVATVTSAGISVHTMNSVGVTPQSVPSLPINVVGVGGNTSASVSWNAPISNGGRVLSDYEIQFSSNNGTTWTTFNDGLTTATSTSVTGLVNGTEYVFRVAARNSVGWGGYSEVSEAVVPFTLPGQPTSVVGVAGENSVALTWNAPISNGGRAITDYNVQYSSNNGATWVTFVDGVSSGNSTTVTGLTNGISYIFRVSAVNDAGTGSVSQSSSAVTARTTPSAPHSLTGTASAGQVALTWNAPTSNGGATLTDYVVQYSSDNGSTWITFSDGVSTATSTTVTGLTNGTGYLFRVAAVNSAGTGQYSTASSALTPFTTPGAPTDIAVVPGDGRATVSWNAPISNGGRSIIQYAVQYAPQGSNNYGTWSTPVNTLSVSTNFVVTGLINGTSYKFRVAATNIAGTGTYSSASDAVTAFTGASAPQSVTGISGDGEVELAWSAPLASNGSAITDYRIQYSSDNGATWTTFVDDVTTATAAIVTGLTNGMAYKFRVAAVNEAGIGAFSVASSAVVPSTAPDAPTDAVATPGNGQVTFAWSAPEFDGGSSITDYFIEYSTDNEVWTMVDDGVSTLRAVIVDDLENDTSYFFRVYAINSMGMSLPSAVSLPVEPLSVPTSPTISRITTGNATLSVYFAPGDDGGSALTTYEYSTDGGATWQPRRLGTTSSPLVISALSTNGIAALSNGTTYNVQIRAVNDVGSGSASRTTTATPVTLPTAPLTVQATPGDSSVTLVWQSPASNGGTTITDYDIEYSTDGGTTWALVIDGTSSTTSATFTSLVNGTSYRYRVSAVNSVGVGPNSSPTSSVTPRSAPSAPTNLVVAQAAGSVTVTWTAGPNGGSSITDYVVQYSSDNGATWTTYEDGLSTATSTTITGLTNGTPYMVRVLAKNIAGTSSPVVTGAAVTPRTSPSSPSVSSVVAGDEQVTVSFTVGSNGGSSISAYQYSTDGGLTWVTASGTTSPIVIDGLTNGTQYSVALRAVNAAGTSITSNVLSGTPRTIPGVPVITTITAGANKSFVGFTLADNGGAGIIDYEYRVSDGTWSGWMSAGSITSPLVVSNLANGVLYDVQIRAVNIAGTGDASAASSTTPFGAPGSPTITDVEGGRGEVAVGFSPGVTGGSTITNYQYSVDGGTTWTTLNPAQTASPLTISGLDDGTTYNVQLKAINAAGPGMASDAIVVATHSVPGAPRIVSSTARDGAVELVVAAGTNGGDTIQNYEYSIDGGQTWIARTPAGIVTPMVVTGLANGTEYAIQVRSVNSVGAGTASTPTIVKPHSVPGAPILTSQSPASGEITLDFVASSTGGEEILGYEYSTDRGTTWYPRTDDGGVSSPIVVTKLSTNGSTSITNGVTYDIQIRAVNVVGSGAASNEMTATPAAAPTAPRNFDVVNGDGQLFLSFSAGSNGGSAITGYEFTTDGGTTWTYIARTTSPLTISAQSGAGGALVNGFEYSVQIRAVNIVGAGTATATETATPRATASSPMNVSTTAGDTSVSVSFSAPVNNGGAAVIGYEYSTDGGMTWRQRDPGAGGSMTASPIVITTLSTDGLTRLTNGNPYAVLLRAVNEAGSGAESATRIAIPVGIPLAPTISAIASGNGQLSISYVTTSTGGSAILRNEYSLDGGATWTTSPTLTSPLVITGLTNGTSYAVQIRQVNTHGTGATSLAREGTPYARPSAPTVNFITSDDASLSLDFTAGSTGGQPISTYEYSTDGGTTWRIRQSGASESPLVITKSSTDGTTPLVNGQFYSVAIRAVNTAGTGTASEVIRVSPYSVPAAPDVTSITMQNSYALLSYTVASDGGMPITGYEYSMNGGITWVDAHSTNNPLRVAGLENGSEYSVLIRARNAVGASAASTSSRVTPIGPPGAPRITSLTPGDGSLLVEFEEGATSGSAITRYEYSLDGGNTWPVIGGGVQSPLRIGGLTNGSIYNVRLRAVNAYGAGISSDAVTSRPYTVPSAPIIAGIVVNGSEMYVAYDRPLSNGGQPITSYEYSLDSGASWVLSDAAQTQAMSRTQSRMAIQTETPDGSEAVSMSSSAQVNSEIESEFMLTITNLLEVETYQVRLRAVNSAGAGAQASAFSREVPAENPVTPEITPTPEPTPAPEVDTLPTPAPVTVPETVQQPETKPVARPRARKPSTTPAVPLPRPAVPQTPTRLPGSGGIAVAPGKAAVLINGVVRELEISVDPSGAGFIQIVGEFVVRITPRDENGNIITADAGNRLRAKRGRTIDLSGDGFAPNSTVEVWVNSTPTYLGDVLTDANGSFAQTFPLPRGLEEGEHTLTLTGTAKSGEKLSSSLGLVVFDDAEGTPSPDGESSTGKSSQGSSSTESNIPFSDSDAVLFMASALTLAALKRRNNQLRAQHIDDEDRESSSPAEFAAGKRDLVTEEREDVFVAPHWKQLNNWLRASAQRWSHLSPALGRIIDDGSYLRSLFGVFWLVFPLAGAVLGFVAASDSSYIAVLPELLIVVALIIVGTLDATSGLIGVAVYSVSLLLNGGFSTTDALLGVLGMVGPMMLVGLVAAAMRPYRRRSAGNITWDRIVDVVLISVMGAWAAGAMYTSIPHLSGFDVEWSDRTGVVELTALVVLLVRYGLENAARIAVPHRLVLIENESLSTGSPFQRLASLCVRLAVFIFVAQVFIGVNGWLIAGAVMFIIPHIIQHVEDRLPDFSRAFRFVPRQLTRIVLMMFVSMWWGTWAMSFVTENSIQWAFVLMGVPGLLLGMIDAVVRTGKPWISTPLSRTLGIVVFCVGFVMVRGWIF